MPKFPSITEEQKLEKSKAILNAKEQYDIAAKLGREILNDERYVKYKEAYLLEESKTVASLREFAMTELDDIKLANKVRSAFAKLDGLGKLIDFVNTDANKAILNAGEK